MIDKIELIKKLKEQHLQLKSDLTKVVELTEMKKFEESFGFIVRFKNDLAEHLNLENNTFYPEYLKVFHEEEKVKKFVNEMIGIGEKITEFFNKYNQVDKISNEHDQFLSELKKTIEILLIRIQMEENNLYDVFAAS